MFVKEKKHEETKDLSHQKIMDIGNAIHSNTLEILEQEKLEAIKKAKEEVLAEAKIMTDKLLKDALKDAQIEHNLTVIELNRSRKEAFKTEGARIAAGIQEKMRVAVEEERETGARKLEIAVNETLEKCELEKGAAVESARKEEQEKSEKKLAEAVRKEKEEAEKLFKKKDDDHVIALAKHKLQMEDKQRRAVNDAIEKERNVASENAEAKKAEHQKELQILTNEIIQKGKAISLTLQEKETLQISKKAVQRELLDTREAFQRFINRTTPFEEGYADYVLPPVKTVSSTNFDIKMSDK